MDPITFAASLMAYCIATDASVTSWGRTATRNKKVGGHEHSLHMNWLAADVVYDGTPDFTWRRKSAARHGLRLVVETDHDHLQAEREKSA